MAAEAKKSFVVYYDLEEQTEDLSNAELGELFRAMMGYAIRQQDPAKFDSSAVKAAYRFVRVSLREDRAKYERRCRTNRENGAKGGRPKANERLPFEGEPVF